MQLAELLLLLLLPARLACASIAFLS